MNNTPQPAPDPVDYPAGGAGNPAQAERKMLCDLLAEVGPQAPTLCAGWAAADLAAHLIIREGRADAGPGILLPPLASYTERVRRKTVARVPYAEMIERLRTGPPKFSIYALPGADKAANSVEFFVHHEDVRRGRPEWAPRPLPEQVDELLWRRLKMVRLLMRKVPAEVTLVRPDGRTLRVAKGSGAGGRGAVRVHGDVGELLMWGLGRTDAAQVRLTGDAAAVQALSQPTWRL